MSWRTEALVFSGSLCPQDAGEKTGAPLYVEWAGRQLSTGNSGSEKKELFS